MEFEVQDIRSLQVDILFDKVELGALHKKLGSIERGCFISGMITSDNFFQIMEKYIPLLQLAGNGFKIMVYSDSIKLTVASIPMEGMNRMPTREAIKPPKELFAKDELQKLNVDFNAVVGQVLGRLGIDYVATKFMVKIDLRKDDSDYQTDILGKKTNPIIQSLLGESVEIQSADIGFKTKEVFLGMPVDAHYNLSRKGLLLGDKVNTVIFLGGFSFENTGIQDLNVILEEYLKRINDVVKKLVGGLRMNE